MEGSASVLAEHPAGVYFCWASISTRGFYKMAMSIGWNPYFQEYRKLEKIIVSLLATLYSYLNLQIISFNSCFHHSVFARIRNHGYFISLMKISMVKNYIFLLLAIFDPRYTPFSSNYDMHSLVILD